MQFGVGRNSYRTRGGESQINWQVEVQFGVGRNAIRTRGGGSQINRQLSREKEKVRVSCR